MNVIPVETAVLRRGADFVHVYGHRAARGAFPENTMAGFRYLLEIGVAAVEFDMLVSADGTAVLTHNPTLLPETTRDAAGRWLERDGPQVSALSDRDLAGFDVGAIRHGTPYHARFAEQARLIAARIPTLDDLCRLYADHPEVLINLEIKSFADAPELTAPPAALVEAALAPIRAHGLAARTMVSSFDWRVLRALGAAAPEIGRGHLTQMPGPGVSGANVISGSAWLDGCDLADHDGSLPQAVADLGGGVWCPYFEDLTEPDLRRAHDLGLVVNVWTVNGTAEMIRMIEMGVDGIITDFPARAQNVLAGMNLNWRR